MSRVPSKHPDAIFLVAAWSLDPYGERRDLVARSVESGTREQAVSAFYSSTGYPRPEPRQRRDEKVWTYRLDLGLRECLPDLGGWLLRYTRADG